MFSPTYFRARTRETAPDPERFCGINLALYGDTASWVFTEPNIQTVQRSRTEFQLSRSRLAWEGGVLTIDVDERAALSGRRVRGRIRVHPLLVNPASMALDLDGSHRWWPVAPSARVEVELDRPALSFGGIAYHDANYGRVPLEASFRSWTWSRADTEEGAAILYDVIDPDGGSRKRSVLVRPTGLDEIDIPRDVSLPRTGWRIDRTTRVDAQGHAEVAATWEDTPFYSRSLIRTTMLGQQSLAVHESLDLRRFTRPLTQLMIPFRMRRGWRAR